MECLGCGYNLAGLAVHRCPECGRSFDPADRASYGPAERPTVQEGALIGWGIAAGTFPLVALVVLRVVERWSPSEVPFHLVGFGMLLFVSAGATSAFLITLSLLYRRWRAAVILTGTTAAGWVTTLVLAGALI